MPLGSAIMAEWYLLDHPVHYRIYSSNIDLHRSQDMDWQKWKK